MDTNINFTNDLNGESDVKTSFNLPRKIYNLTAGRAVADGAIVVESESCTYETMLNIDRTRLLNEASLLLLPNTYKEGKLYSHKPLNGNGDFTATRATTATRVNAAGLVDLVPYNLLSYSEQFDNAAWTRFRATITTNNTTAPDGTLTADTFTANGALSSHELSQSVSLTLGVSYSYSVYAKKNTNNFIQLLGSGAILGSNGWANFDLDLGVVGSVGSAATASIENVGNGWYRCTMTAPAIATTSGTIVALLVSSATSARGESNTLSTSVFIWGAQFVEGTSARDYLRTETRLNIPRVDFSLGGCPNILLEPQRTNLALQSSSFDNATWVKTAASVTANSTTSPSGVIDADTLTADGTAIIHRAGQVIGVVNATTYSHSVYAKKGTGNFLQLLTADAAFGGNVWANFDLNNGVVGTIGSAATASIENAGNGWYRCILRGAAVLTTSNFFSCCIVSSATAPKGEGTNISTSLYLWGAQLEAGAYATSYIPTTTASVTRNADSITRNNIFTNGLITAAGGTWFVELRNNRSLIRDSGAFSLFVGDLSSNPNNGLILRSTLTTSTRLSISKRISSTETTLYNTLTDTIKVAFKWNGTTADVFVNGVKQVSATAFTTTNMEFLFGNAADVPKYIQQMALYPTPLSDSELISMTTL